MSLHCGEGSERDQCCSLSSLPAFSYFLSSAASDVYKRQPKAPYYITGVPRGKKMAHMKEQIKAPEKIQLRDEEIANLSVEEFKTLVIRMLTEMVQYGCKMEEKLKAMKNE